MTWSSSPYEPGGEPERPSGPEGGGPSGPEGGGPPPPGQPPPQPGYNVMAILSLVFAFVFAPVGIVFGHVARRQIRQSGEQGETLATAGLVLSYIFTGLAVLACCAVLGLIATGGSM